MTVNLYTIYKIYSDDPTVKRYYIGQCLNLKNRKKKHKHTCRNIKHEGHNSALYKYIRANGGFKNFRFVVLQRIVGTITDCYKLESAYMEVDWKRCLNKNVSYPTRQSKERRRQWKKEWWNKHAQERYADKKVKIRCEYCFKLHRKGDRARHKRTKRCMTKQLELSFNLVLHKFCDVCNTKVLIKDPFFNHNCQI